MKQPELVELAAKSFIYTGSGLWRPLLFCGWGSPPISTQRWLARSP